MMRKISTYLMICTTLFFVSSCKDEVSSPPKSNLAVDKTSGLANETEFIFTIDAAPGAGTISLLPYGTEKLSLGGIPITSFENGKANFKFKYTQVGTFNAVVSTNNHSSDGKSVKNVYSTPIAITITSGKNQITEFSFAKITKTENYKEVVVQPLISLPSNTVIDQAAHTIKVEVPYDPHPTSLIPTFTADPFAKVTVGGSEQTSAVTANDYALPKTYTVTANNGSVNTYTVTVTWTPINNDFTFKSFGGKETSKAVNGKILGSVVASSGTDLILYDVYDALSSNYDSIQFNYALNNPFAVLHYGSEVGKMNQDRRIDLVTAKTVKVLGQDSVAHTYTLRAVAAPLLELSSPVGTPTTVAVNTNFNILVKALKSTVTDSKLNLTFNVAALKLPSGITLNSITLKDIDHPGGIAVANNTNMVINFSDAVTIILNVKDANISNITYDVTYTAGLTELK